MDVKFNLTREGARLPERGHSIDVGLDVFAPTEGVLLPGPNKVPLGFTCEVPVGYCAAIYPRSGMASGEKTLDLEVIVRRSSPMEHEKVLVRDVEPRGIAILAQLPPVDPGYTGEVHAIVLNASNHAIKYPQHTRFGQLVFVPTVYARPVLSVDDTRKDGGFGSTGL